MITNEFSKDVQGIVNACFKDRFALIVPTGMEKLVKDNVEAIRKLYPCTGILVQKIGKGYFYHATSEDNLRHILEEGFKFQHREIDNSSFGNNIIYTFEDPEVFRQPDLSFPSIAMISYTGPYLQSIFEEDKPDRLPDSCMLFPIFVNHVLRYAE